PRHARRGGGGGRRGPGVRSVAARWLSRDRTRTVLGRVLGLRKILCLELDRHAVRRAVRGAVPGIAIARQRTGVCYALLNYHALERGEPVPIIGLASVRVPARLRALDFGGQHRGPFGPGENPAVVEC